MLKHIFITWSSTFVNICVVIVTCYVTILLLVKLYVTSVYSWVYYILSSLWIFVPATSCSIRVLCLSSVISRNDNDCIIISSHWKSYPYCIEMYKGIFIGVHIHVSELDHIRTDDFYDYRGILEKKSCLMISQYVPLIPEYRSFMINLCISSDWEIPPNIVLRIIREPHFMLKNFPWNINIWL